MTLDTERDFTSVFYKEVFFIFRIVWFVTGSAHQFTSGAEEYRISVSPLLGDVCCLSRGEVHGVGGAIAGGVF
jgi:hypothetical protein